MSRLRHYGLEIKNKKSTIQANLTMSPIRLWNVGNKNLALEMVTRDPAIDLFVLDTFSVENV